MSVIITLVALALQQDIKGKRIEQKDREIRFGNFHKL
jgi:hypothetical protein